MQYEVDFSYVEPRWGQVEINADDADTAEADALDYIKKFYPEALDIKIDAVKEIKDNGSN
jgi:hypothetical protein